MSDHPGIDADGQVTGSALLDGDTGRARRHEGSAPFADAEAMVVWRTDMRAGQVEPLSPVDCGGEIAARRAAWSIETGLPMPRPSVGVRASAGAE